MIESISSRLRFRRLPYSAAQQPVQCRLQAEVGSSRIAQGMLQPYFFRYSSCTGQPIRLALSMKFVKKVRSTPPSTSWNRFMISLYMLLSGLFTTARTASRCAGKLSGPSPANLSTQAISLGRFSSGFFSRYFSAVLIAACVAAFLIPMIHVLLSRIARLFHGLTLP